MNGSARRLGTVALSGVLVLAPAGMVAAAPADTVVELTSAQLTEGGFPKKPNTTAWAPGTASLPTNTAAQWEDVVMTGAAPAFTQPGQVLTMSRYQPVNTQGDGTMKPLNITAVVRPDRTFTLHFQLGYPGTYGYSVGYSTGGTSPEFVGLQFQFTTTGTSQGGPGGTSSAVQLSKRKLAAAGFTMTPNVIGWGGTAAISASKARAGAPVTIAGTAPSELPAGTVLSLERFVATDTKGSGSFEPVANVQTVVRSDGTYSLTFEVNQPGRYGYTLGAGLDQQWVGVEFQLKTT